MTFWRRSLIGLAAASGLLLGSCSSEAQKPGQIGDEVAEPATADNGWNLVWSDEFDSDAIDPEKWDFDINCWGGGNEERQCYTKEAKNAFIEDGKLVIRAIRENAVGPALPPFLAAEAEDPEATAEKPYTSARLVTRGKAAWKYGRIEVRAKFPQGQGTWPAIWMMPEDAVYGGWAKSGEIDILETVNLGVPCADCPGGVENTILGTLHFGDAWPDNDLASTEVYFPEVLDGFHTYGVIWREGEFIWTVDGRIFATKSAGDWFTTSSDDPNAPFDQRFHLILNLAIGGGLPEKRGLGGVSEEGFPKQMEVDWVRVWQCQPQDASQAACSGDQ